MNGEQLRLLSKMKKLINSGNRRFQVRKDRDYVQDLLEIGISESQAWMIMLELNKNFYFNDPKPSYYKSTDTLLFKKQINGIITYIKLKLEKNKEKQEETVCLSFHKDKQIQRRK